MILGPSVSTEAVLLEFVEAEFDSPVRRQLFDPILGKTAVDELLAKGSSKWTPPRDILPDTQDPAAAWQILTARQQLLWRRLPS